MRRILRQHVLHVTDTALHLRRVERGRQACYRVLHGLQAMLGVAAPRQRVQLAVQQRLLPGASEVFEDVIRVSVCQHGRPDVRLPPLVPLAASPGVGNQVPGPVIDPLCGVFDERLTRTGLQLLERGEPRLPHLLAIGIRQPLPEGEQLLRVRLGDGSPAVGRSRHHHVIDPCCRAILAHLVGDVHRRVTPLGRERHPQDALVGGRPRHVGGRGDRGHAGHALRGAHVAQDAGGGFLQRRGFRSGGGISGLACGPRQRVVALAHRSQRGGHGFGEAHRGGGVDGAARARHDPPGEFLARLPPETAPSLLHGFRGQRRATGREHRGRRVRRCREWRH